MKEVKLNGRNIKIYDDIKDLPIKRFHIYNKYVMVDSGVGSDLNDANGHFFNAIRYIKMNNKESALVELQNLRQLIFMISEGINPKHLSFIPLIHSIDGIEFTDLSDDNIKRTLELINKEKTKWFDQLIESLKKK